MKTTFSLVCSVAVLAFASPAAARPKANARIDAADSAVARVSDNAVRSSASYTISAEVVNGGGGGGASAAYSQTASLGEVAGLATVTTPAEVSKAGFLGQLYEVTGLALNGVPTNTSTKAAPGSWAPRKCSTTSHGWRSMRPRWPGASTAGR